MYYIMAKKKKTFTADELDKLSAEQILDKIKHENYSLLTTLGAENLRREMVKVGKICNAAANYIFASTGPKSDHDKHIASARRKIVRVLKRIAPGDYSGMPNNTKQGLVIGFNHPTLGEIMRFAMMKIDLMGDKPMYFPVNLPWYEALAPNYERLKELGIVVTPTITPSTWNKMGLSEGTPEYTAAKRIKKEFRDMYTSISHDGLKAGGVVFVAPSATRQATVYKNKATYDGKEEIIPTMSMLALKLYADPEMNCDFLPVAVIPGEGSKRGLNFFKHYRLVPGEIMTAKYIRKKYLRGKKPPTRLEGFDRDFHQRIADKLPKKYWY